MKAASTSKHFNPTMVRRNRAELKRETLERVHAAARAEIAAYGIAGASIDRLTEAAGYSRGAFYGNYRSKEELVLQLMKRNAEDELDNWRLLLEKFTDVDSFLRDIGIQFNRYLTETVYGIFWIELNLHARRNADFAELYDSYVEQILGKLDAVLLLVYRKLDRAPPADLRLISTMIRNLAQGSVLTLRGDDAATMLTFTFRKLLDL